MSAVAYDMMSMMMMPIIVVVVDLLIA